MAEATIDRLSIEITSSSDKAVKSIDRLVSSIKNLKSVSGQMTGLQQITTQLERLRKATEGMKISANIGNQLNNLSKAVSQIKHTDGDKLAALAEGLKPLSELGRSNLTSFINQLGKLPAVIGELDKADMGKFASQMRDAAAAIRPLADEMNKVAAGFSAFPSKIQKIIQSNENLAASSSKVGMSMSSIGKGLKLSAVYYAVRRAASVMADWVTESNNYVENLNLFTVAMGEGAEAALHYAEVVNKAVGIDPSEWIRNQGLFKQITSGFGVVTEKADLMSKNLTQLGYDISSFYNIPIEEAMAKVQSAISGELEPVRRLGYAIDVATLQQVAYNHGIMQSVDTMTQAQKSQLRYVALMEQSGNVMGDFARTVQTPANAMRILQQQVTQLSRSLGNLLIPFLQEIIPWIQAFVEVLTDAVNRLAELVGFELPQIDYSGVGGLASSGDEAAEALDGAAKAAKELKNATIGIDELNVISPPQASAGAGIGEFGGDLGLELPEYDFLAGLDERTDEIKGKLEDLLKLAVAVGAALAAWKLATLNFGAIYDALRRLWPIIKTIAGALLTLGGGALYVKNAFDAWNNGLNFDNLRGMLAGIALAVSGLYLLFGKTGAAIGLVVGAVGLLTVGFRDWIANGTTAENITAIGTAVLMIAGAGVLLRSKLLLATAAVIGLGSAFLLALPQVSGMVNVGIEGAKNFAGAFGNTALTVTAAFMNVYTFVVNVVDGMVQVIGAAAYNIFIAFHNAFTDIEISFNKFSIAFLNGIQLIVGKINSLLGVFGMEIDVSGLSARIESIRSENAELESEKETYKDIGDAFKEGFTRRDYFDLDETMSTFETFRDGWAESAFTEGAAFGQQLQENVRGFLDDVFNVTTGRIGEGFASRSASFGGADFTTGLEDLNTTLSSDLVNLNQTLDTGVAGLDTQLASLSNLTSADTQNTVDLFGERSNWLNQFNSDLTNLENTLSENQIGSLDTNFSSLKAINTSNTGREINTLNANTSDVKAAIANAASRIVSSTDQIRINIYNTYSMGGMGFASGGFPEPSQLFYAREGGAPELVGQMGSRTAVANNDQIVEGIRAGVADANTQQNALLAEQNELLRGILAKTGVILDGKQLLHSVERAERRRGAAIMTGGGVR